MSNERKLVFLTATVGRPSTWLRVLLTVAAITAGVILLWLGLVLTLAAVVAATLALLPVGAWRLFTASRRSGGPATIEGEYTIASPSSVEARDEAPGRKSTGDAKRPDGPLQ